MAEDIGAKIGIDGEAQFKSSLGAINSEIKALNAEMKNIVSSFDGMEDSEEGLTAKTEIADKAIEAQKRKLGLLDGQLATSKNKLGELGVALEKAKRDFGENSLEAGKAQNAYNKQETAVQNLKRQISDTHTEINKMNNEMNNADVASVKMGGSLGKLKGLAIATAAGIAALGAAVGIGMAKMTKASIEGYAEYEQLVGGVDTLFKENSAKLQGYANDAYKTAGMSANEYMETATSFSASLIQSLGGDTEKAVGYANRAITDMSDNANKMGSDISSIQNAYQGFAKQNYTMLDNLKLGYGGTKEEMERLLADATAISGIKYDISSYADVVDAIHIIQKSMGVAGATAAEAESTIEGSINAAKGAIQNWLVGLGNSNADITQLTENMVDSVVNVVNNIEPILDNIIEAAPIAIEKILNALIERSPDLINAGVGLIGDLAIGIVKALPSLAAQTPAIIWAIISGIGSVAGELLNVGGDIVEGLWKGISNKKDWLKEKIKGWCKGILTNVKDFFGIHSPSKVFENDVGLMLPLGAAKGIDKGKSKALSAMKDLNSQLLDTGKMIGTPSIDSYVTNITKAGMQEVKHSGTIKLEGVNSKQEFVAASEIAVENMMMRLMRKQVRLS